MPFSVLVLYFQFWYTLYISSGYTLHIRIWHRIRIHTSHDGTHLALYLRIYTSYSDMYHTSCSNTHFTFGTHFTFDTIFIFGDTLHASHSAPHIQHTSHSEEYFIFGFTNVPLRSLPLDHDSWALSARWLDSVEHWDFSDQVCDAIHRRLDQLSREELNFSPNRTTTADCIPRRSTARYRFIIPIHYYKNIL